MAAMAHSVFIHEWFGHTRLPRKKNDCNAAKAEKYPILRKADPVLASSIISGHERDSVFQFGADKETMISEAHKDIVASSWNKITYMKNILITDMTNFSDREAGSNRYDAADDGDPSILNGKDARHVPYIKNMKV